MMPPCASPATHRAVTGARDTLEVLKFCGCLEPLPNVLLSASSVPSSDSSARSKPDDRSPSIAACSNCSSLKSATASRVLKLNSLLHRHLLRPL